MALNTWLSPQWWPASAHRTFCLTLHTVLQVIRRVINHRTVGHHSDHQYSNPPFFPTVGVQHVNIQIPHMRKGMLTHWTPYHSAKIRALPVRIFAAVWLVLQPCLAHSERFGAEWAYKPTFRHYRVSSMLSFMVLVHGLSTREQLPTHRACSPLTMNTRLGVFSPVSPRGQHLPTLTTWEFLTPVDAHVNLCPVVGLEDPLADWAWCLAPGDRWYIIGDFSCLPGLVPSWKVFTPEEGQNLLFHPFQGPLLNDHFVRSYLEQCWSRSRLGFRNAGLPEPLLATPGAASIPSASSLLEMPTFGSSSVSEGCRIFQGDAFSSVHSHTDFNRSRSAFTEKQHVGRIVGPTPLY